MQGYNPFLPSWEYVPDGEPRLFNGRVYLYGSHDLFNSRVYCEGDYVCWSAPEDNLKEWRCEGVIYRRAQEPFVDKGYLYAPDVVRGTDGMYYLYYAMSGDTTISVAVSDKPSGAFEFFGHVRHADGRLFGHVPGDVNNFDPSVLVDDDGSVFLYTGFTPKLGRRYKELSRQGLRFDGGYVVGLSNDMLTLISSPVLTIPGEKQAESTPFEGHAFFEASSIRKINGRYTLIWSSVLSHELCYATGDSPMGPFTFGGTVISIADIGMNGSTYPRNYIGNTHGGLVEVCGQWYVFYHRQTNRLSYSRQACAEPVTILPDGRIPQVGVTSCGLNGAPLNGTGRYEARIACHLSSAQGVYDYGKGQIHENHPYFTQSGEDREKDGDQYIANMQDGAYAGFRYFIFDDEGRIAVTTRGLGSGILEVATQQGGTPVATLTIHPSEAWTKAEAILALPKGVHGLCFTYRGTGSIDMLDFTME